MYRKKDLEQSSMEVTKIITRYLKENNNGDLFYYKRLKSELKSRGYSSLYKFVFNRFECVANITQLGTKEYGGYGYVDTEEKLIDLVLDILMKFAYYFSYDLKSCVKDNFKCEPKWKTKLEVSWYSIRDICFVTRLIFGQLTRKFLFNDTESEYAHKKIIKRMEYLEKKHCRLDSYYEML